MSRSVLKLAVVGKGGAGKTVLCTLLARRFAAGGSRVLALDLDTSPGLAISLGLDPSDSPLPEEAIEENKKSAYGWALRNGLDARVVVSRYGMPTDEGIIFLGLGNTSTVSNPTKRYIEAIRKVAQDFNEPGWVMVGDLSAGPTTPFEAYERFASFTLVAVEAAPASILAGQRIRSILSHNHSAHAVVVTKSRGPADSERVEREVGEVIGSVPHDADLRASELSGRLSDPLPDGAVAGAVDDLVEKICSISNFGEVVR
jgi:CO dehydrogenase maturation factor